jgi:hypothetical protein
MDLKQTFFPPVLLTIKCPKVSVSLIFNKIFLETKCLSLGSKGLWGNKGCVSTLWFSPKWEKNSVYHRGEAKEWWSDTKSGLFIIGTTVFTTTATDHVGVEGEEQLSCAEECPGKVWHHITWMNSVRLILSSGTLWFSCLGYGNNPRLTSLSF